MEEMDDLFTEQKDFICPCCGEPVNEDGELCIECEEMELTGMEYGI